MDAVDHGKRVLALVLAGRSQTALRYALRRLTEDHFPDAVQRALFAMAANYYDLTGGVLTREAMDDALRAWPAGTVLLYQSWWDALAQHLPREDPKAALVHSVSQLRELAAERATGEALAQGMEILAKGAEDGGRLLRGHADARNWVLAQFAEVERELAVADAPEGDMRGEGNEVLAEYSTAVANRHRGHGFVATGIPTLDRALGGGMARGELDLIAAFTSVGKTGLCCQIAWDAVVNQGKNVVYFTTETLRPQVRIKVLSRHSRLHHGAGLNSRDIKSGYLSREGVAVLERTVRDFDTNPAYGHLYIAQVPRGATVPILESRLARVGRDWDADLVIIDYLMLLRSETSYRSKRESLAEIVNDAKALATNYKDGRGVPVLSPWQVNKEGWQAAREGGAYDLGSTAETAEARNTADLVVSLLETGDTTDSRDGRRVPLRLDVLKNRDGERGRVVRLVADYATSCFEEQSEPSTTAEDLVDI